MTKLPKEYWKISFPKDWESEWNKSVKKLDVGYRWQVESALNSFVLYKQPWRKYPKVKCSTIKNVYLFDISHSGIGKGTIRIMVRFDKALHIIQPIFCEMV